MNNLGIYYPDPRWFEARLGLVTSSKVHDAITKRQKGGTHDLAARRKLKFQMLAEISSRKTIDHFVSQSMDWGIECEPKARKEYEFRTGRDVEPLGIVMHPTNQHAGATADGWVVPDGILEIKCPDTDTHWEYMHSNAIPAEYLDQINWQMACCGPEIEWCDFVSYDPRIEDAEMQMLIIRHERDSKRIAEMEDLVNDFYIEVIQLYEETRRNKKLTLEDKLRASIQEITRRIPRALHTRATKQFRERSVNVD